jgi:xylulokinase
MGIDIGTSGCKAVVFDESGKQLFTANREYDVIFSNDGNAELDSNEVINKCFDVIKECSNNVGRNSIKGFGISSQGEAFTAIGRNGENLCNAMVSSDMRSQTLMKECLSDIGEDKLYQITGHTAHPMFTLFKLFWFKKNKPDLWGKVSYFLCFEDLLQFRLGLKPVISWSLAGRTMMFDVRRKEWNKEILDYLGITSEQLAQPRPSGYPVGRLSENMTNHLGLCKDAFVVTGGHDQPCNALGAGVLNDNTAILATGTVECITPVSSKPIFSEALRKNNLCTYNYAIENLYTTVAFSTTGGNILKWFRDEFGQPEILEANQTKADPYEYLLRNMDKKPSELLVLPYFTPSATPYFDTQTKGAILGFRLTTRRGSLLRALLEGVAFEMRLNLEILENSGYVIKELKLVGGGSKSSVWAQLKADVMNKNITTLNINDAGCLGTAVLACSFDTGESVQSLVPKWVKPVSCVSPQSENVEWYTNRFEMYKKVYESVRQISL